MKKFKIEVRSEIICDEDDNEVHSCYFGTYNYTPQKQEICYDEYDDEGDMTNTKIVCDADGGVAITRTGTIESRMEFGQDRFYMGQYQAAGMSFEISCETIFLETELDQGGGRLSFGYILEIMGDSSHNRIEISVKEALQ